MRMSTPLLASERRARLRELLAQDGAIRLESAAELLRVSAMTVRRDLADLEAEGVVRRDELLPRETFRQGERIRVKAENGLAEETTVHWHGIRTPNAMDGVPHLTQAPIPAGGEFLYEFDAVDAGTFWYHPHQRSSEQVGRGLYGPLIIEEHDPIRVDRDLIWMLDDWRMTDAGDIYLDTYSGWYDVRDELFYSDADTTIATDGSRVATDRLSPRPPK